MRYIQIRYIQFRVKIWQFRLNRTCGDDCTFFFQVVIIIPTDEGLFFSGRNCVKIGFGGNVTTGKKTYSRLAGYVFQRVQITTGKNYDRKKKRTVVRPSVGNWKKIRAEKKRFVQWVPAVIRFSRVFYLF